MTMTEALVHEFQHNKLNAALDLDPFLENAFDELVVHRDGRVFLRGDDSVLVPWRRVAALPPL
mgnify:CR=1 FL=1